MKFQPCIRYQHRNSKPILSAYLDNQSIPPPNFRSSHNVSPLLDDGSSMDISSVTHPFFQPLHFVSNRFSLDVEFHYFQLLEFCPNQSIVVVLSMSQCSFYTSDACQATIFSMKNISKALLVLNQYSPRESLLFICQLTLILFLYLLQKLLKIFVFLPCHEEFEKAWFVQDSQYAFSMNQHQSMIQMSHFQIFYISFRKEIITAYIADSMINSFQNNIVLISQVSPSLP